MIELRKFNLANKGSELMLLSTLEFLKKKFPNLDICFNQSGHSKDDVKILLELNLIPILSLENFKINLLNTFILFLKFIFLKHKVAIRKDIDVIFDLSGFAYGDQWKNNHKLLKNTANLYKKYKDKGAKIILMPQAFGPFSKKSKKLMAKIIKNSNLVFARDEVSLAYLNEVSKSEKIILKPDFTNSLSVEYDVRRDSHLNFGNEYCCIIPNTKMLLHAKDPDNYLSQLRIVSKLLIEEKLNPFFLIHEMGDFELAQKINENLETKLPLYSSKSSLDLKKIIKHSKFVFCSRYHSLISCLSQSVPCFSTSWSHKYESLLDAYNHLDGLIENEISTTELKKKLKDTLKEENLNGIRQKLIISAKKEKDKTDDLWNIISKLISESLNH